MILALLVISSILIQAYEGERVGNVVTADETTVGLGGGLDASLDRISSKLQQEKMNRLLSLDDDGLSSLLKSHDGLDDPGKEVVTPVRPAPSEDAPRLKQVAKNHNTEASILKGLKDQLSMMLNQQASILAKQETVQKELAEIRSSLTKEELRDKDDTAKLETLKNEIISAVARTIQSNNKRLELPSWNSPQQPPELDEAGTKRSVLAALKKTLADLKAQVLPLQRSHGDQRSSNYNNYRFSQRPLSPPPYSQLPAWQPPYSQYNEGAQRTRMQDKGNRRQDSWGTDAGDPNYVMSVDEDSFAPQGTPLYSDQTVGFAPDYSN